MNLTLCKIAFCVPVALLAVNSRAQEVPLSARIHQRTDVMVDGQVVNTLESDTRFYRSSDGSTLTLPVGDGSGTLWDNKAGVAYRLDLKEKIAYEDPHSLHTPNPSSHNQSDPKFPNDEVEGITCTVVPVTVRSRPGTPYETSVTPGKTCVSSTLGLELKSDVVVDIGSGKTERLVKQLRDIKVNAELDPKIFDPHQYTIYGPQN